MLYIFRNPDYRPEFRVTNLYIKFPLLCIQVLVRGLGYIHVEKAIVTGVIKHGF